MPKVANLIIAHKNPAQLQRLISQFDADLFHNFIHLDGRRPLAEYAALLAMPQVTFLEPRRKLNWAGYGFVQVTLEGMAAIVRKGDTFGYINVMSGQDYPIRATGTFHDHLYRSGGMEFFDVISVDPDWPLAMHRYERYHLIEYKMRGRYRLEDIINSFISKRLFYKGKLRPFGRSAWFTATREFVVYALRFMNDHPDFVRFLKTVWSPDEFLFNTLVMNSSFQEKVVNSNLRYIDWSEGKVNPKLLTAVDFPALCTSDCFLARKFDDAIDSKILDLLDEKIVKMG